MEDGGIDGLGDIGAVGGRAGEAGVCGETDLVVDNKVNGSSGGESRQRVEAKGLVNNTLTGERSISMDQNTHSGFVGGLIVIEVLDGAGLSENNGILRLQMRGVGNQRQVNTLSRRSRALKVHAQVVLDIARSLVASFGGSAELAENRLVGLAYDVGQDIETTAVRHTNDDILHTIVHGAVNESLHSGNHSLTTLKTESLVVGVFGREERLERGRPDKAIQNTTLLVIIVLVRRWDLDALSDPVALISVWDVDVLDSDGTAVDGLTGGNDLAQSHLLPSSGGESRQDTRAKGELVIQIPLGKLVVVELELAGLKRLVLGADSQRVDLGLVVSTDLVGTDKKLDLQVLGDVGVSAQVCARED